MAEELHPNCVRTFEDMPAARTLAEWLSEKGFPAVVWAPNMVAETGDSLGLSPETVRGFEVRVNKQEHVEPAKQALEDLRAEVAASLEKLKKRAERTGTTTALCEECGGESEWPASSMGKTEVCPHCQSYLDVLDPEDDEWNDVDVGEEDEDEDDDADEEPTSSRD